MANGDDKEKKTIIEVPVDNDRSGESEKIAEKMIYPETSEDPPPPPKDSEDN